MQPAPHLAVLVSLLGGCVVVEERPVAGPIAAAPVAIPLAAAGTSSDAPHDLYYGSVLQQMRAAWLDRDPARLRGLLDQHDRADSPSWTRTQFAGFRGAALALEFESLVATRGSIGLAGISPALGEPITGTVLLGPLTAPIRLGGGDDKNPAQFLVTLELNDRDAFGDTATHRNSAIIRLPAPVDFTAGGTAELPFSVAAPAAGSILRTLRIAVDLLPGLVLVGGEPVPNARVRVAASEQTLFPRGVEPIRDRPLVTLRNALQSGASRHFANAYLAAYFLGTEGSVADREAALTALLDRIRLGRPDQVRMAIAAGALLAPDGPGGADRAAWLRWWDAR